MQGSTAGTVPDVVVASGPAKAGARAGARDRILDVAYDMFCRHGIRAVGVDTVVERSAVAKMSLYRHYPSKESLVLAVMRQREQIWTRDWLQAQALARGTTPREQLLAIFDVFDGWFRKKTFEGCLFINVLLEIDDRHDPLHIAARGHLANIRAFIAELARDAGIVDPEELAHTWHILMKGSIVAAAEGDRKAALRARQVAVLILNSHRV